MSARLIITLDADAEELPAAAKITADVDKAIRALRALGEDGIPLTVVVRRFGDEGPSEAGEDHLLIELALDPMLIAAMGFEMCIQWELRRSLAKAEELNIPTLPLTIELSEYMIPKPE